MDNIRKIVLYFALIVIAALMWNAWMRDYPPATVKPSPPTKNGQVQKDDDTTYAPSFTPSTTAPTKKATVPSTKIPKGNLINVKTDVLAAQINTDGGAIVSAKLPKYPISLKEPNTPVTILNDNPERLYLAQSGLTNITANGKTSVIQYQAEKTNYELQPGQNEIVVTLTGKTPNGLNVKKQYIFKRDHYAVDVKFQIENLSGKTWQGSVYNQITRKKGEVEKKFHSRYFQGASISSPEKPYEKLSYKTLDEGNISRDIQGGWIAMQQQYFLSTWIPSQNQTHHYYSHVSNGDQKVYTVGYYGPPIQLAPKEKTQVQSTFYVGPEIPSRLKKLAKGLDLTIDYGWLWPISELLFWIMAKIHAVVGNWGWSIVLVTLLIKIIFYPLSNKSYKSMSKMRELQPRLQTIKERYGDDKQAMSKATMELYKKEKVNPMGGCLPMLIQIPVFIALYYVLIESVELRQAPWIFWIKDLSVKDPYYVLPILMAASMFLQQKLSPPPPDPTQAKVMLFLPIVFLVFFLTFPAGLVLYWLTNNVLSVLQQWYIMKTYDPKKEKHKKRKWFVSKKSKKK